MSIGLEVKLSKPIVIRSILPKIGKALQEILGLSYIPEIIAEEWVNQTWIPLQSALLTVDSNLIGFRITSKTETASVFSHFREGDYRPEAERGVFAIIEVTGMRNPMVFALTSAVAIALARECGSEITDNVPFFTEIFDQPVESFVNTIKVEEAFDDCTAAAQIFYNSCYAVRNYKKVEQKSKASVFPFFLRSMRAAMSSFFRKINHRDD